jgi:hypothetical protein
MNSLAAFNLTIVGGFVLPASHSRARHVIQAGLITVRMVKNSPCPAFPPSLQPIPELPAPKPTTPGDILPAIPPGALSLVSVEAKAEPTVLPSCWPRGLNVTVPTGIAVAR